jgi:hypothetical protein
MASGEQVSPAIVLAATAWTSFAVPVLFGVSCLASGLDKQAPDLFLALMLQAVASPMMAAPALAALMGLDATLVLVALITSAPATHSERSRMATRPVRFPEARTIQMQPILPHRQRSDDVRDRGNDRSWPRGAIGDPTTTWSS